MPRRLALLTSSLAVVALLAGCGGDDDSADDEGSTTTTTAEESTTAAGDDATEGSGPDEPTDPTEAPDATDGSHEPETTEGGGGGEADEEFCAAYAAFDESVDGLPDETVEDIQAGVEVLREGIGSVAAVAPEALAADVDVLVDAVDLLVEEAADATTVEEAQQAGSSVFEDEDFQAAAERVQDHYETCPQADDDATEG
jgi:hypothetical protein